jgi:DNA sulfur modification protein DndC
MKDQSPRIETAKTILKGIIEDSYSSSIVLGFSGGKDSTVLLHLTLESLMNSNRNVPKLVIVHCNTFVENPTIENYSSSFMRNLKTYLKQLNSSFEIKIVTPQKENTYWCNLIGKGYPLPHRMFRWCQRTLKIKPMEDFIKTFVGNNSSLLLGHRADESQERKKSLKKNSSNGKLLNYENIKTYVPLSCLTEEDVWRFLLTEEPLWGGDYETVVSIYKDARGECPLLPDNGKNLSGCGSRFGCWVCTLVKEDKSLKNQSLKDLSLQPYLEFRNWLIDFCSQPCNRYPFTRTGKKVKMGYLTLNARKYILSRLLNLECTVKKKIVTIEELNFIKKEWEKDKIKIKNIEAEVPRRGKVPKSHGEGKSLPLRGTYGEGKSHEEGRRGIERSNLIAF